MLSFRKLIVFMTLTALSLGSFAMADEPTWDVAAETQITDIVNSQTYANQIISYQYENKLWDLRIIYAPVSEKITSNSFDVYCPYFLFTRDKIPNELFERLQNFSEELLNVERKGTIYMGGSMYAGTINLGPCNILTLTGTISASVGNIECNIFYSNGGIINGFTPFDFFSDPKVIPSPLKLKTINEYLTSSPLAVAFETQSAEIDTLIQQILISEEFRNEVFEYHLEGKVYRARFIHNPNYQSLKARQTFSIDGKDVTYTWTLKNKYYLIFDKTAPQELVTHLSQLVKNYWSWSDWFHSQFTLWDGTIARITIRDRTYSTIPFFHITQNIQY